MRRLIACAVLVGLTGSAQAQAAGLPLRLMVRPQVMRYDYRGAELIAYTTPGALCWGRVVYSTGHKPVSFRKEVAKSLPATSSVGRALWTWHEETKGTAGTATVTCTLGRRAATATTTFVVIHRAKQ